MMNKVTVTLICLMIVVTVGAIFLLIRLSDFVMGF